MGFGEGRIRQGVTSAWDHDPMPAPTIDDTAARLAALLTYGGGGLSDPDRHDLMFEDRIELQPLLRRGCPTDVWTVDSRSSPTPVVSR